MILGNSPTSNALTSKLVPAGALYLLTTDCLPLLHFGAHQPETHPACATLRGRDPDAPPQFKKLRVLDVIGFAGTRLAYARRRDMDPSLVRVRLLC